MHETLQKWGMHETLQRWGMHETLQRWGMRETLHQWGMRKIAMWDGYIISHMLPCEIIIIKKRTCCFLHKVKKCKALCPWHQHLMKLNTIVLRATHFTHKN